jgi:serine/threonine protein phosphatase PrpC
LTTPTRAWVTAHVSVTGTAHQAAGTPCQDRHTCEYVADAANEPVLIVVVADGASSAAASALGAETAVQSFSAAVAETLGHTPITELDSETALAWLTSTRAAVLAAAEKYGRPARDLACTVTAAVISSSYGLAAQIGDGIIAFESEANWELAFHPHKGEHRNETRFITDATAVEHIRSGVLGVHVSALAVASDGIEDLCLDREAGGVFAPFFAALCDTLRKAVPAAGDTLNAALQRFLTSERVNTVTDDDKTLVLAASLDAG